MEPYIAKYLGLKTVNPPMTATLSGSRVPESEVLRKCDRRTNLGGVLTNFLGIKAQSLPVPQDNVVKYVLEVTRKSM